jgi:hypothetical protein
MLYKVSYGVHWLISKLAHASSACDLGAKRETIHCKAMWHTIRKRTDQCDSSDVVMSSLKAALYTQALLHIALLVLLNRYIRYVHALDKLLTSSANTNRN